MLASPALKLLFFLAAVGAAPSCHDFSCNRKAAPAATPAGTSRAKSPPQPQAALERVAVSPNLVVDQFGYRPLLGKVAIITDPRLGWNAGQRYTPGETLEVRRFDNGEVVFSGKPLPFRAGALDPLSGDQGSWFDFSALTTPGNYVVYDPKARTRSYPFVLAEDVYRNVLSAALRMFYFNRANVEKKAPFACVGPRCWLLPRNYLGAGQDGEARSVRARDDAGTARDCSGGWWDAGDVNKYVTFTRGPVHQLLTAYWEKPGPFRDDLGIPESQNGIPDVLDEVRVELDWLRKMQLEGGGVLLKVGNVDVDNTTPDLAKSKRFYYPDACSSATVVTAGVFAHAALLFQSLPQLASYAAELRERAVKAFAHYTGHPRRENCDDGTITGGDADRSFSGQDQDAVVSAIYLFALTGAADYDEVVRKSYALTRPFQEDRWSAYDPDQGDALLFYTTLPNAEPKVRAAILERKRSQAATVDIYGFRPELDLYRAYMRRDSYHWGSNQVRANYANTNYDLLQFKLLSEPERASYEERVGGLLHYFHGVNPLGLVYLSNMAQYGAEKSVSELFHAWFRDGDPRWDSALTSRLGPAPGYVPGGPNVHYCEGQEARCATSKLRDQPPGKAYLDFNTGWDPKQEYDRSWELTEPAIYYQSAYVKLLSKFVD